MDALHLTLSILSVGLLALLVLLVRLLIISRRYEARSSFKLNEFSKVFQEQEHAESLTHQTLTQFHQLLFESDSESEKSLIPVAQHILDACLKLNNVNSGLLLWKEAASTRFKVLANKNIIPDHIQKCLESDPNGLTQLVEESRHAFIVDDYATDSRLPAFFGETGEISSSLSFPLQIERHVMGIVHLFSARPNAFGEERQRNQMQTLLFHAAFALETLELYANVQNFYAQMVKSLDAILSMKENILHAPDRFEKRCLYVRALTEALSLPRPISRQIEVAAMTYAIGKIGLDETLLRKPGKLTQEEYDKIKKHPEISLKMMGDVQYLSSVLPMVLYHQERWDGKGYPAGLCGEEIPLGSRILAVVNAYEAMTSDRPYRKAMSAEMAKEELIRGSGSQFDPRIIDVFLRLLESSRLKIPHNNPS